MPDPRLQSALAAVPPGHWGVAVSGGADSVALLTFLRGRADLRLHVIHLDHQTRGPDSTADAAFVADLARAWAIPATTATRSEIEPLLIAHPANRSAFYRALRWALFRKVAAEQALDGVLLAHHQDDQAETIFQRLLRSNSPAGVRGMSADSIVAGVRILRPLLAVPGQLLRNHLRAIGQTWREDASNRSAAYQRNRVRAILRQHPSLAPPLLDLAAASHDLRHWLDQTAPFLPDRFATRLIADLPAPLADHALRTWLRRHAINPDDLTADLLAQVRQTLTDLARPGRLQLPARHLLRRRSGQAWIEPNP